MLDCRGHAQYQKKRVIHSTLIRSPYVLVVIPLFAHLKRMGKDVETFLWSFRFDKYFQLNQEMSPYELL